MYQISQYESCSIVLLEMFNRKRYMIPYIWIVSTDNMHS